jgi:hypothetical protein
MALTIESAFVSGFTVAMVSFLDCHLDSFFRITRDLNSAKMQRVSIL